MRSFVFVLFFLPQIVGDADRDEKKARFLNIRRRKNIFASERKPLGAN